MADPKSRLEPPKGTLPYGKGLVTSENPGKVKTVQGLGWELVMWGASAGRG